MFRRTIFALAALAAGLSVAVAQVPSDTSFLDQVEVRVINVDVVVLDRNGNRVTGLEQDDFEVLENGRPVELTNFAAYTADSLAAEGVIQILGPAGEPVAAPAPDGTPAPPPTTWAFFYDQTRIDPGPRSAVLEEFAEFARQAVRGDDRALAASFDGISLKVLSPLGPVESTLAALEEGRKRLGLANAPASRAHFIENQILSTSLGDNPPILMAVAENFLDEIDAIAEEESVRGRAAMQAFGDLLAILSGVEGRVAVVLLSGGYEMRPGERLFQRWQAKFGSLGLTNPNRQLDRRNVEASRDYARLLSTAGRGRFTIYSVQAGKSGGPDVSAEVSAGSAEMTEILSGHDPTGLLEGSSVAAFSTATGGRTFNLGGDLSRRLEVAREDFDTYYSLGYRPTGERTDESRRIEVKVRREGLRALHRVAVSEASWRESAGDTAVTALLAEAAPDPTFGAEIQVGAPGEKKGLGKARLVPVTVNVPLRGVTLLPEGATHRGRLFFQFAVKDPDGGFRRLESRPLEFQVPNEQLAAALRQHVAFRIDVKLEPGSYRLAAAVLDELGGLTGVTTAPVVLAAQ